MGVKMCFVLWVRRASSSVVGRSFRASHLGLHRCCQGLGVGGWVLKNVFFGCVVWLVASWEARLGHRISDCIDAGRVWGWVGECKNVFCFLGASRGWLRRGKLV